MARFKNDNFLYRTNEFRELYLQSSNIRCIADNFFQAEYEKKEEGKTLEQSNKELAPMLTDIFGAAQDTFTAAVQWFIVYLIKYPDVQREVSASLVRLKKNYFQRIGGKVCFEEVFFCQSQKP